MENAVPDLQPAPTGEATPETLPASTAGMTSIQKQLYKVILDGQEAEVDIDELTNGYAANKVSQKRFSEAANSKKEAIEALQMLKESPRELFKMMGMNPREVAETMLSLELDELTMDPKDKELRDWREKAAKQQKLEQEAKERTDKELEETRNNALLNSITGEMTEVLSQYGFEPSPYSAERFRYYMQAGLNAGHVLRPKDVSQFVINDIKAEIRAMMGGKDIDKLSEMFGDDLIKKIARASVGKAKKETIVPKEVNANRGDALDKLVKANTPKDWFRSKGR